MRECVEGPENQRVLGEHAKPVGAADQSFPIELRTEQKEEPGTFFEEHWST